MAVQQVKAGLEAIYCSGWQVAADANNAGHTYPDQSLYPADSVPTLVRRINNAMLRAEQIDTLDDDGDLKKPYKHWMAPIVADAEAGFGGPLNAYELVKALVEAGAAGIHLEDQLASAKKCGHLGGKVLVPTKQFIQTLIAARLACDVLEVPTVIIARTDALSAQLITSDVDTQNDWKYCEHNKGRTSEGFYYLGGDPMERTIARGLAYAPYADVLWFETSEPDMHQAWRFADAIRGKFPGKMLAYNCSPSFNWKKKLSDVDIARFQDELGKMGYKFQFVTLAGFHALSHGMFKLAHSYKDAGMTAYAELQEQEFASEKDGYTATRHQREVGTGYFDTIAQIVSGGTASTLALEGSTETAQFTEHGAVDEVGSKGEPSGDQETQDVQPSPEQV
jgi:isocitrate lyase